MSGDFHSLSAAYALNALSGSEREQFERHLDECDDCRVEVAEFLATVGRLGSAEARIPPERLKEQVLAEVATTRQVPPRVTDREQRAGPRHVDGTARPRRRATVLAAAAVAATLVAGGVVVTLQQRELTENREQTARLSEIVAAEDARLVQSQVEGGGTASVVVSQGHDAGALVMEDLPPTTDDQTYQLWLIGDEITSAGIVDPAEPEPINTVVDGLDDADMIGLTVEPAGGSEEPTSDPILALEL